MQWRIVLLQGRPELHDPVAGGCDPGPYMATVLASMSQACPKQHKPGAVEQMNDRLHAYWPAEMRGGRDRDRTCDFCRVKETRAPRAPTRHPTWQHNVAGQRLSPTEATKCFVWHCEASFLANLWQLAIHQGATTPAAPEPRVWGAMVGICG
jgi:hypothetical protein